jgi:outer membrane protein assembly factor BamB
MSIESQIAPGPVAPAVPSNRWPIIRLILGWALTIGVLDYAWARVFVFSMVQGRPELPFVGLLVAGLLATMIVTRRLGTSFSARRFNQLLTLAILIPWTALVVVLVILRNGSLLAWPHVVVLLLPGTFWVVWSAWMFYWPWRWETRFGITASLLLGLLVPWFFLEVDGLTGGSQINFTLRKSDKATNQDGPTATEPVDLTQTSVDDFPQFLGPQRLGVLPQARLSGDWNARPPREVWRRRIGGMGATGKRGDAGWGGFAVVGNFAITQEQQDDKECVVCYRVSDGARLWLHADPVRFAVSMGGPGPRATPTIAEGRVYTVGATGILNCLDGANGQPIWSVNILEDNEAENLNHGVTASPLVVDNQVIVCPTGVDGKSLAAYDRETGRRLWRGGAHQASYGSPVLTELCGVRQVLLYNSDGVTSHAVDSGQVLWHFPWTNSQQVHSSQPIPNAGGEGQVFVSTEYGKGCALVRVEHAVGGRWSVKAVWKSKGMKTKFSTAVQHQGFIYGLDQDTLACLDLATGEVRWREGRYEYGQIILAGDLLLIQAEDGEVVLVEPNPAGLRELGRIRALSSKTWNTPTLAGRFLLVRNDKEAACYELPLREQ